MCIDAVYVGSMIWMDGQLINANSLNVIEMNICRQRKKKKALGAHNNKCKHPSKILIFIVFIVIFFFFFF